MRPPSRQREAVEHLGSILLALALMMGTLILCWEMGWFAQADWQAPVLGGLTGGLTGLAVKRFQDRRRLKYDAWHDRLLASEQRRSARRNG
jgi:hypothetical protein